MAYKKGLDISEWNENLNYTKLASQIDFVIPREGCRQRIDKQFLTHVNGFKNAGVKIPGVYHFIYALNETGAIQEAKSAISNVQKAGLPKTTRIWADLEYDTITKAKQQGVNLGRNEINRFTQVFCETIEAAGYPTGIYTNIDYYRNYYNKSLLDKYALWLADYSGSADYPCMYHQYTSSGRLSGYSGFFDMNYLMKDDPSLSGVAPVTSVATPAPSKISTSEAINAMIATAKAEVGYLEKRSNSQLDSKTANAGSSNYTKYWRDVYPAYQQQAWCACFVSWVMMKTFSLDTAKKLLKHWPYVYCPTMASLFKLNANPKVGDIVIFYRGGTFAHTGIVTKVEGDKFWTVEGNTSGGSSIIANGGGVCEKSYYNSNLPGTKFCTPDYSIVTSINGSSVTPVTPSVWKATGTATSTSDDVNVRKSPDGDIIGQVNKGNRFEIDGTKSGKWVHVKVAGIGVGYIYGDYVKEDKPVATVPQATPAQQAASQPAQTAPAKITFVDITAKFPELDKNDQGVAVSMLQILLGVGVTGILDTATVNSLNAFKKNVKLSQNGKVDKATWNAIINHMNANTFAK